MLLPSGLARSCVELVPRGRYGNILQATLLDADDPLETLWRHRFVYGNSSLSDIAGKRVGAIAAELLAGDDRFHAVMLGPLAGRGGGDPPGPVGASAPVPASLQVRLHGAARSARRAAGAAATILRNRATHAAWRVRARRVDAPEVMTDRRGIRFELVDRNEIEQFMVHGGHF